MIVSWDFIFIEETFPAYRAGRMLFFVCLTIDKYECSPYDRQIYICPARESKNKRTKYRGKKRQEKISTAAHSCALQRKILDRKGEKREFSSGIFRKNNVPDVFS